MRRNPLSSCVPVAIVLSAACALHAAGEPQSPSSTWNLLLEAKCSGNLESYRKGLRGAADHMVFDLEKRRFKKASQHHEYGVGFGQDLGVVPVNRPAFWVAEWPRPILANRFVLSGVYPNQPQPRTGWKIELRRDGKWVTHARGTGGWYDRKRYEWGGLGTKPIAFDAMRVSVFSPDGKTPIKSIHFRGEKDVSWVVAFVPPIAARIILPSTRVRVGEPAAFRAEAIKGALKAWTWDFGGEAQAKGERATHTFARPGTREITLTFSDGVYTAEVQRSLLVAPLVEARVTPLGAPVLVGKPVAFSGADSAGPVGAYEWDFGDESKAKGETVRHTFARPGIYEVKLTVSRDRFRHDGTAIVRVHTPETLHVPQVFLDTDQKNEQDDQHYLAYGVFSELDVLGVNSIHHGGGQERINYEEILHVLDLARKSGLPAARVPLVFRGANRRLDVPESGRWSDTVPIVTDASRAILAAARGASPTSPIWIVPVGPGTNTASAILQARLEGLELRGRLRVMWLGGSNDAITNEFNGNNDPWSLYVVAQSGIETWIMPAPVGGRVRIDKRTEGHLYADHPLGAYLKKIVPARNKPLFDPSCLSAIISMRLGLDWIHEVEPVHVAGPGEGYRWTRTDAETPVRVIREIDTKAMQLDIFNTIKGKATRLIDAKPNP